MSLTLELTSEAEQALREVAEAMGNTPADCAAQILVSHLEPTMAILQRAGRIKREMPVNAESNEARLAAINSLRGKYVHLKISSAEIRANRELDKQREEQFNERFEKRSP